MNLKFPASPLILLLMFSLSFSDIDAQKKYWIFFSDKNNVEFDPYTYFNKSTIGKRSRMGLQLIQYTDLPVREDFVGRIEGITRSKGTVSRWLNAIAVGAGDSELKQIKDLPFVTGLIEIKSFAYTSGKTFDEKIKNREMDLLRKQLQVFGSEIFTNRNLNGEGIRIAVFDGGFPGVDKSPLFEHIRRDGRIIATYDFVRKDSFVYDFSSHGTMVLTCIAGKLGDENFGLATGAEFLLARTEVRREIISEEENWVAAMEWADRNGADIISSSLGYTFNRYFPQQMDGKYTLVSRAANMAASKGMLVINAAGNDGDKKDWQVINAPADADSVLSVGGISPETGIHINFSSFGPTYDERMKPNICAFGKVVTSDADKIRTSYGTSFATPLISGFAACVMQMHPEWGTMKVFDEIQRSGHLYPYFDYAHGFGIPQASYFVYGKKEIPPSFRFLPEDDSLKIIITEPSRELSGKDTADNISVNKGFPEINSLTDKDYLYFRINNSSSTMLTRYGVVDISNSHSFGLSMKELKKYNDIQVYYKGYIESYKF